MPKTFPTPTDTEKEEGDEVGVISCPLGRATMKAFGAWPQLSMNNWGVIVPLDHDFLGFS